MLRCSHLPLFKSLSLAVHLCLHVTHLILMSNRFHVFIKMVILAYYLLTQVSKSINRSFLFAQGIYRTHISRKRLFVFLKDVPRICWLIVLDNICPSLYFLHEQLHRVNHFVHLIPHSSIHLKIIDFVHHAFSSLLEQIVKQLLSCLRISIDHLLPQICLRVL